MAHLFGMVRRRKMELMILLKAGIKKKKSALISIALLMMIVTSVVTAILSAVDNYKIGFERAFETADCGDTAVFISSKALNDELKKKVESSPLVERAEYIDSLITYKITCGNYHDGNREYLQKLREGIKLFGADLNGFEENIPALREGEVYLPLGMRGKINCDVGDTVIYDFIICEEKFKIAGFVQEPALGSQTVGWKQAFISDGDYDRLYEKLSAADNGDYIGVAMMVYKAEDCGLSAGKFQRELNLETKIMDMAYGALTREQTLRFSTLMPEVLTKLFMVFAAFLFIIVLILVSHSISTEIETDYVTYGILKSQGFTGKKLSRLFFAQYLGAELLGVLFGTVLSIPIEGLLTDACRLITGTMPNRGLSVGKSLLLIGGIVLVSVALIFVKTLPLAKLSPVKAIGGGKEDVYFDSRIKLPISKKLLSLSLAFRQFTSAKRKYISVVLISVILIFFMITVNLIINFMNSKNTLLAMGTEFSDIGVYCTSPSAADEYINEVKEFVEETAEVKEYFYSDNTYLSVNGENLMAHIVREPEKIIPIIKGRQPLYDNEIVITEMIAELLEVNVGDEVTVSGRGGEEAYIIAGIYQTANDSGMCFALSEKAMNRLYEFKISNVGIVLSEKDSARAEEIVEMLKEKYEGNENISFYAYDINSYIGAGIVEIVDLMRVLIYVLSVVFAMIAVRMVCTRTFLQERTDIGIYKALGFTSKGLRLGFGFRFLITAILGSLLGIIVSLLLSAKVLGLGMSLIGLSKLPTEISFISAAVPAVILTGCFFVFAYWGSGKVKKVEVRELVVE